LFTFFRFSGLALLILILIFIEMFSLFSVIAAAVVGLLILTYLWLLPFGSAEHSHPEKIAFECIA